MRLRGLNLALGILLLGAGIFMLRREGQQEWQRHGPVPLQLPAAGGGTDRCASCHRGVLEGKHRAIPGHRDLARFGCTPCHGGQGRRLDRDAHAPRLGSGRDPFLQGAARQARCARCHVPGALAGAPVLNRGFQEVLDGACGGCHQPGREDLGLGPDLRQLGRRSAEEIRRAILDPQRGHPSAVMSSFRWRFDPARPDGKASLEALIVALLAISDSPEPYRAAWARPSLRVAVECTDCHLPGPGRSASGSSHHRCSFLRRSPELHCSRCHRGSAPPRTTLSSRRCPQLIAASSICGVCHLRGGDGAALDPARER
jgi:hypothetical protein